MSIERPDLWAKWVTLNPLPYGQECLKVALETMRLLEEEKEFDAHAIMARAAENVAATEFSGYMAGFIQEIVGGCHSRGYEFKYHWDSERDRERLALWAPASIFGAREPLFELPERKTAPINNVPRARRNKWTTSANGKPTDGIGLSILMQAICGPDTEHQSAIPSPKLLNGLRPPWQLEYEAAGLL